MAMDEGFSLADAMALTKNNDGLFNGGTGGILALIIIFVLLFGNGGWGYGNRGYVQDVATQSDIQRGFDTNTIVNKLDGISNGICSLGYDQLGVMNGINTNIMQSANGIGQGIAGLSYQLQQCCCQNGRDADRNTRDILEAICADGRATRDLITENEVTRLRTDLQSAQLTLANVTQTQNILNTLGRFVTNPPCYGNYGYNGYNFNGVTVA